MSSSDLFTKNALTLDDLSVYASQYENKNTHDFKIIKLSPEDNKLMKGLYFNKKNKMSTGYISADLLTSVVEENDNESEEEEKEKEGEEEEEEGLSEKRKTRRSQHNENNKKKRKHSLSSDNQQQQEEESSSSSSNVKILKTDKGKRTVKLIHQKKKIYEPYFQTPMMLSLAHDAEPTFFENQKMFKVKEYLEACAASSGFTTTSANNGNKKNTMMGNAQSAASKNAMSNSVAQNKIYKSKITAVFKINPSYHQSIIEGAECLDQCVADLIMKDHVYWGYQNPNVQLHADNANFHSCLKRKINKDDHTKVDITLQMDVPFTFSKKKNEKTGQLEPVPQISIDIYIADSWDDEKGCYTDMLPGGPFSSLPHGMRLTPVMFPTIYKHSGTPGIKWEVVHFVAEIVRKINRCIAVKVNSSSSQHQQDSSSSEPKFLTNVEKNDDDDDNDNNDDDESFGQQQQKEEGEVDEQEEKE